MARRPEPCILFAQTFVHSQLDEFVDEVLFAEPIVVTACEFLEQNATLSVPSISLVGATTPPSFAMEVFVHCEGESRFRRLCQPFLYSHSSSNVLEVEPVVTNHLVVRGCYRSLTLIICGNTAEDLGQFNIDFDFDNSLVSLVSSPSEGKLEDLPPALLSDKLTFEESISSTKTFSLPFSDLDLSSELKRFLRLALQICKISENQEILVKVAKSVISVVCSYVSCDYYGTTFSVNQLKPSFLIDRVEEPQQVLSVVTEASNELLELYRSLQIFLVSDQLFIETIVQEPDANLVTSQLLVEMLFQCFPFLVEAKSPEFLMFSQSKVLTLGLNLVLLVCSARESCLCFVNSGGMDQIASMLGHLVHQSTTFSLLLLGVVENATQHAIGCEGFLGWWPRKAENVPTGGSDGYSNLLKLLLTKQRHDVASLATYILQRLRLYEAACRYESAVLSVLAKPHADNDFTTDKIDILLTAASQLKQILKLLNLTRPVEDPSSAAFLRGSAADALLSYKATAGYISLSKYSFSKWDVDIHMLSLLKERGFFTLSSALLSHPLPYSANRSASDILMDTATSIQSLLLSLLFCRSGLTFLLLQPESIAQLVHSLQVAEDRRTEECLTLRQASVLMSKGFFCNPREIAMVIEVHLRVGNAIDRLLAATTHSDELLWVLWELCTISRSPCGRQALLSLGYFPEALLKLMEALHSFQDLENIPSNSGTSPLSLATFHSAAEILEVMVTDSTASSLNSWIGNAIELHQALHLSSPGSNMKDAPTRLLEWIDAGVVYHKNGSTGLLRYAAILASGGDAHLNSTRVLVSESMDVENVVGDSTNASDTQILDVLLGKLVCDKFFEGVALRSSSIIQLTTAMRILSFISEDSAVVASLFDEGAVSLVYVVLLNCKYMLEQSSNTYDYLVDEGAECNSTSELLLERIYEQNLVDLMIPSLILLINLLRKLQEAKVNYRNKKLVNALLRLHREVSPKVAACATDCSFSYPILGLGFGSVCHLLASALAFWAVKSNWAPGLFHCLLESVQVTSSVALGPKDACSMLHLLCDFLPEEGLWLWCTGIPPLSALRTLSIGSILGPEAERDVDWFLQPEYSAKLIFKLTSHMQKIEQIVLHFAFSTLVVIQDMLRVFILRVACQKAQCAFVLLRPLISWIGNYNNDASLSETTIFKVYRLLDFIANLLEHPHGKTLLLKLDVIGVLVNILKRCNSAYNLDGKSTSESRYPSSCASSLLSWTAPLLKSLALIFDTRISMQYSEIHNIYLSEEISCEVSSIIALQVVRLCQVLPVGRELLACIVTLKEFSFSSQGRTALLSIFSGFQASLMKEDGANEKYVIGDVLDECNWRQAPPFLQICKKLIRSLDSEDDASNYVIETVYALSLTALCLCVNRENLDGVPMVKCLFGLLDDEVGATVSPSERIKDFLELISLLDQRIGENGLPFSNKITLLEVKESVKSLLLLLQSTLISSSKSENLDSSDMSSSLGDVVDTIHTSQLMVHVTMSIFDEENVFAHIWKLFDSSESDSSNFVMGGLVDKFMWECPDTSPDRLLMPTTSGKRKMSSTEMSGKRIRENLGLSEAVGSNAFSRGLSTPVISSGPSRRDTFRQRKPNTSRPPSMHVDDYVARERNIDGACSSSHIITSSQRGGSTSGRPPSVHVDEFEARQRERQNPAFVTVGSTTQVKPPAHENRASPDKIEKARPPKPDLDDDLHEIDIVFDEESGSDDRLPFPQPDDNLPSKPVEVGESSPGSIVEETEGNANEGAVASEDVDLPLESALIRPISQQEMSKKVSISSDKKHPISSMDSVSAPPLADESKFVSPVVVSKGTDVLPSGRFSSLPSHLLNRSSAPPLQPSPPPSFHQRDSPRRGSNGSFGSGSQGYYEHRFPMGQPPLPPLPPPNIPFMSPQTSEAMPGHSSPFLQKDAQPLLFSGYQFQSFNVQPENLSSAANSSLVSVTNAQPVLDNKYMWNTDSPSNRLHGDIYNSNSSRPLPPLPPMPPPFSTPMAQLSASSTGAQSSLHPQTITGGNQLPSHSASNNDNPLGIFSANGNNLTSFSLPSFTPQFLMSRSSVPGPLFGSPSQQHSQGLSQSMPSPQPSIQLIQPQPPPPPPPRPHPSQNFGIPLQVPQQSEHVMPMQQNSIQVQMQPMQMQQQIHIPQVQLLYQTHQPVPQQLQPPFEEAQQKIEDNLNQQDPEMTLQQFFASPEAIQSLLSDRDKLCQLLEQHPKLMQMLQDRL